MLSFPSTMAAMAAERALTKAGLPLRVMPTLRQVSASCGISLRIEPETFPALCAHLSAPEALPGGYALYAVDEGGAARQINTER